MFLSKNKVIVSLFIITIFLSIVAGSDAVPSPVYTTLIGNFKKDVSANTLFINGKLSVVFIGALYCPYCAMESWAVVMALSNYGTFSNLGSIISSEANIASYNFINATFTSDIINFQSVEAYDNTAPPNQKVLEPLNSLETQLFNKYASGSIPFICIGGSIFQIGAGPNLSIKDFQSLSFTTFTGQIQNKTGIYSKILFESQNIEMVINQSLTSPNTQLTTATSIPTLKTNSVPSFSMLIILSSFILLVFKRKDKIKL